MREPAPAADRRGADLPVPRPDGTPTLTDFEQLDDGPLLSTLQVSALLSLDPCTVREIIEAGDVRGVRLGRNYRIVWRSVKAYLYKSGVLPLTATERALAHTQMRAAIYWVMRDGARLLYIGSTDPTALQRAWTDLRDVVRRGHDLGFRTHWQQAQLEVHGKVADAFFNPVR